MRVRLSDVVSIVARQVDPRLPEYAFLPLINGENIESGTTRLLFRRTAADEGVVSPKYEVSTGDIVYSKLRPYLRKVVVAIEPGLCSADSYPLRPDLALVDPQWLAWMLVSDRFTRYATDASARARMPKLNREQLFAYEFDLPALDGQSPIAVELSAQLHLVDVARAAAAERGARRERLLEECLANQFLPRPDSGWAEAHLRDVVDIQLGKMLSPASKTGTRPVPYLRNANVQWDRFALSDVYEMDFTEAEERKFRLEPGDVLVCEGGQPGRAAIWAGEIERCCYQKALHRLRPIAEAVDPRFLMYRLWLGALRGEFVDNHSATTIAHLPAVRLAGLKVRLPSLDEQRRIVVKLREELAMIDAMGASIRAEQQAIGALPAALLRRAFEDLAA